MIKASDVLMMLIPEGGWATYGDEYEDIVFLEANPISKEEFTAGISKYEIWKKQEDDKKAAAKASLLEKLGITEDEAKLLLS